jgi:hypothetical protein
MVMGTERVNGHSVFPWVSDVDLEVVEAEEAEEDSDETVHSHPSVVSSGAEKKVRKKKCGKCGTVKEITEFGKHSQSGDGHQSYCKKCKNGLGARRMEFNIDARLKHHTATRIQKQLGSKCPPDMTANLEKYLGYKFWELKAALEKDCKERLNMSLRATLEAGYHLDHIKPLSLFQVTSIYSEEFRACWAISNLRMIPAAENLAKGAKFTEKE